MKRITIAIALAFVLLSLTCCREKVYFTDVSRGETYLAMIGFEDGSQKGFTVVTDVLYAENDTSSRYKMVFYLPDDWDDTYPILLDRYVPNDRVAPWAAYQGAPVAEAALNRGEMIVVLIAYNEWTAIPDILLAEHFLKEHDDDLPGDSKNILTAAFFDYEVVSEE